MAVLTSGSRVSIAQEFLRDAMEAGNILGELSSMLVGMREQLTPDGQLRVGKALGYLGTAQRHLAQAKAEVRMAVQIREGEEPTRIYEQTGEISNMAVEFGYSRNLEAPLREMWYAHPNGNHLRTFRFGEGLGWELYQVGKSVERGFGPTSLRERFSRVHRDIVQEVLSTAPQVLDRSPGLNTRDDTEYLIRQVGVKPLERFEVRQVGTVYPTYVSFDPEKGKWLDYHTGEEDSRTISMVQRWKKLGSPTINVNGGGNPSEYTRTGAAMETPDQFTGYEHTVDGRGRRPYGYSEKHGVVPD